MSAYQKRYVALEIFYLGAAYHGFASQADAEVTVEVSAGLRRKSARRLCGLTPKQCKHSHYAPVSTL